MEKLNQVFSSIKDRLSNPLVFSFCLSWLVFNWRVVVALIFYDSAHSIEDGQSLIPYIFGNTYYGRSFIYPFLIALAYTFGMPFVLSVISAAQTSAAKLSERWSLNILKGGKIPIEKYFSLREEYKKQTSDLIKIIDDESVTKNELDLARRDLRHALDERNKAQKELNEATGIISSYHAVSFIEGRWVVTVKGMPSKNIRIVSGIVVDSHNGEHLFRVHSFFIDIKSERVTFMLVHHEQRPNQSNFYSFSELRYQHNEMVGTEYLPNERHEIRYVRPNDFPQPDRKK